MIKAEIKGAELRITEREALGAGGVNSNAIALDFSEEWTELNKQITFINLKSDISRRISANTPSVTVPWEVLTLEGDIDCYIRGVDIHGNTVLRTCTENLGFAVGLDEDAEESASPTPEITDGLLADIAELEEKIGGLELLETGAKDNLVAAINEAASKGGAKSWSELEEKPFATVGAGLTVSGTELRVDASNAVEQGNTKPVTSAAVYSVVGNIQALLNTI